MQKFACEVRIQQTLVEEHRDQPVAPQFRQAGVGAEGNEEEPVMAIETAFPHNGMPVGVPPPTARIPWVCGSRFTTRFIPFMGGNSRCYARRVTERDRSSS